jgi:hypothetical protein
MTSSEIKKHIEGTLGNNSTFEILADFLNSDEVDNITLKIKGDVNLEMEFEDMSICKLYEIILEGVEVECTKMDHPQKVTMRFDLEKDVLVINVRTFSYEDWTTIWLNFEVIVPEASKISKAISDLIPQDSECSENSEDGTEK